MIPYDNYDLIMLQLTVHNMAVPWNGPDDEGSMYLHVIRPRDYTQINRMIRDDYCARCRENHCRNCNMREDQQYQPILYAVSADHLDVIQLIPSRKYVTQKLIHRYDITGDYIWINEYNIGYGYGTYQYEVCQDENTAIAAAKDFVADDLDNRYAAIHKIKAKRDRNLWDDLFNAAEYDYIKHLESSRDAVYEHIMQIAVSEVTVYSPERGWFTVMWDGTGGVYDMSYNKLVKYWQAIIHDNPQYDSRFKGNPLLWTIHDVGVWYYPDDYIEFADSISMLEE